MSTLITLPRINPTYQALQRPRHPDIPLQTRQPPALPSPSWELLLSGAFSIAESMLETRSHADSLSCGVWWYRMSSVVKSCQCHIWGTEWPHLSTVTLGIYLLSKRNTPLFRSRGARMQDKAPLKSTPASHGVTNKSLPYSKTLGDQRT